MNASGRIAQLILNLAGSVCLICFFAGPTEAQVSAVYVDPLNLIHASDQYLSKGIEMIRFGDPEGAIQYLKKNRTISKITFESEFLIGYAAKQAGNLDMAIDYFSKATRYESLSLPAFFERANCYLIRKNFGAAVSDYNRAIIIDSTFAPAYNNRAFARIRHYGDKETSIYLLKLARKDLEKVIALNQGIPATARFEYFFNLGLLDLYQSEYMSAKLSFDTAIAANPGIAKIYYYRGAANFLARYYQRAALDFKKASELGFLSAETPEFLKVIDLINAHEALTGEHVGR